MNEPFKGITSHGTVAPDLFPIRKTGVSTRPVVKAAGDFLAALTPAQRTKATFVVEDAEWRKWSNVDFYVRQGIGFIDMDPHQQQAALGLLKASLSAKGLALSRDIMRLNYTLGEMTNNFTRLDSTLYWFTIMGTPSEKEPWGWQIDGHHLIINYFVLGDQVVMTPTFMGSEPVVATSGAYKGTSVLQAEQDKGLAFMDALNPTQQQKATVDSAKVRNNIVAEAFKDNVVLDYAGIPGVELSVPQKDQLLDLIREYVRNMDEGHAKIKMAEVREHLDQTYFAWIGKTGPESVFYYRIQSQVILIEFDHQGPVFMGGSRLPTRQHIHTVVRTPNGNDYGKDLLREHYQTHPHPHE